MEDNILDYRATRNHCTVPKKELSIYTVCVALSCIVFFHNESVDNIKVTVLFIYVQASERGSHTESRLHTINSVEVTSGSPDNLAEGVHTITYHATDLAGNTGLCSFDITVKGKWMSQ